MEINFRSFKKGKFVFPLYHKPTCAINQMLEAPLLSVFDLNIQLRERPNLSGLFFYYTEPALLDETVGWLPASAGIGLPNIAGLLELNQRNTES